MTEPMFQYCLVCGARAAGDAAVCPECRRPLTYSRAGESRIPGVAFLLNEAQAPRMERLVPSYELAGLRASYEAELAQLTGRAAGPQAAPDRAPAPSPAAAAPRAPRTVPVRAQQPPRAPREPRDWSWLADQQANLFLFAGAFLVVVAALIYVAYSGQTIGGALKMSLLCTYTLAFLAAGVTCLGYARVRTAGQVFFAVGALLVPLNFLAAYNIFSSEQLDAPSIWLAGSLVTAAFYGAVASTGVGRQYGFAAGLAAISSVAAGVVASGIEPTFAPVPFLVLATAMLLVPVLLPQPMRERLTSGWRWQAHGVALLAAGYAVIAALLVGGFDSEMTRWFLLPAFAVAAIFYAAEMLLGRSPLALVATVAALCGAGCGVVFGAQLSGEYYAFAFIAAGAVTLAGAWLTDSLPERMRYERISADAIVLAQVAVALGVIVAIFAALQGADVNSGYEPQTRWFLPVAFACAAVLYALSLRRQSGSDATIAVVAFCAAFAGMACGIVYAARWSPEYHAFALAGSALVLLALAEVRDARFAIVPAPLADTVRGLAHAAAAGAAVVAIGAVEAAASSATYDLQTRWSLPALFAVLAAVYAATMLSRRASPALRDVGGVSLLATVFGVTAGVVYALDVSAEYYAFAFAVPAIAYAALGRWPLAAVRQDAREALLWAARAGAVAAITIALGAVYAAAQPDTAYRPDSGVFLPLALLAAAVAFGIDASRGRRYETTAPLLVTLAGAGVAVAYAAGVDAAWYAVAFAGVGLVYGFGLRGWSPSWLEADAAEHAALVAMTIAWLPFEAAFADAARLGAGVHLAAAALYASAAVSHRDDRSLARMLGLSGDAMTRVRAGWLYAAGLTLAIGYVDLLRTGATQPATAGGSIGYPLLGLALAFAATGLALRAVRPELRAHLYVMALIASIAAVAAATGDSTRLALVLTACVAASTLIAAIEDAPMLGVPAAVFGIGAVAAWVDASGATSALLPLAYAGIGLALYAGGFALLSGNRRWSDALRAAGGAYALVAPAAGFAARIATSDGADVFQTTALYEATTLAVALAGVLALVESSVARRGWMVVAASGVMLLAVLMQIGRFQPSDPQAYTAVIGIYLVLLGALGLSRFRLIPQLEDAATYTEALGAVVVMLPTFAQSLGGGWGHTLVLLVEATVFFSLAVSLRRRGLLLASAGAVVLVAGRVLFDAVHALPNWIIVLLAGMALLGIGMTILVGRDRWTRWQDAMLAWWDALSIA